MLTFCVTFPKVTQKVFELNLTNGFFGKNVRFCLSTR